MRRILTEPEANLIRQHQALMATEGVTLDFTDDAIDALADAAVAVNGAVENIGARRLQTVLEKVVEEISFTAGDRAGETVTIDGAYVRERVGDLAQERGSVAVHPLAAGEILVLRQAQDEDSTGPSLSVALTLSLLKAEGAPHAGA